MTRPYALTFRASRSEGYDLAEALGFDDVSEALSVSVFDDGPDHVNIEALYESLTVANQAAGTLPNHIQLKVQQTADEDWVGLSQSGLAPILAGRFVVHGSHDDPPQNTLFPIKIDAGQAFGTGHHGTTRACLLMLDQLDQKGVRPRTILDLGTGAGILAIAAAKIFPDADILATDIDPVAVEVTDQNAEFNGVQFDTHVADGFDAAELKDRQFDLTIANILAGPLRELAPRIADSVKDGGYVILSGILDEQADWVASSFRDAGLDVKKQPSLEGWTSLLAHKKTTQV